MTPSSEKSMAVSRSRSNRKSAGSLFLYLDDGSHVAASTLQKQSGICHSTIMERYKTFRAKGKPVTIETLTAGKMK